MQSDIEIPQAPELTQEAPIIDEDDDCATTDAEIDEAEIKATEEKEEAPALPPNHIQFGMNEDGEIPDDDIRRMLFLFAINENIPIRYKRMIGKIVKLESYKNEEKINIFNTIGYVWEQAKENKDIPEIKKVILLRKLYKQIFGSYYDD
jgi:hypothetical protein